MLIESKIFRLKRKMLEITLCSAFLLLAKTLSLESWSLGSYVCLDRDAKVLSQLAVFMCNCSLVVCCRGNRLCRAGWAALFPRVLPLMDAGLPSAGCVSASLLQVVSLLCQWSPCLGHCGGVIWEPWLQGEWQETVAGVQHLWSLCYWCPFVIQSPRQVWVFKLKNSETCFGLKPK